MGDRQIRKGAVESVCDHVRELGGTIPDEMKAVADRISDAGGTPLAVSENARMLGIIHLEGRPQIP